jgi:hypothetical protein
VNARHVVSAVLVAVAVSLLFVSRVIAAGGGHQDVFCDLVWEIPGETEDYLLGGLLVDADWDRDGNLCVVDYNNKNLKIFGPDGRFLRTIGRAGEGPGESRDARRLLMAGDGRLGLLQVFPASVVWLHPDGTPGGRITVQNKIVEQGGFVATPHAVQRGSMILVYASSMSMIDGRISERHWIAPLQPDGTIEQALFSRTVQQPERDARNRVDEGDYYDLWAARWAPDGNGGVWLAPERDRYLLMRHDRDGAVRQTVTRPYNPVVRDDLGRRLVLEQLSRKRLSFDEINLRDHAPVVRSLRLSDTGRLWIDLDLGGRGPRPGTIAWLDVLDRDGSWLPQIRLHGPYDPETDQWCFVDDKHVLVLHSREDGEVRLRLLRR